MAGALEERELREAMGGLFELEAPKKGASRVVRSCAAASAALLDTARRLGEEIEEQAQEAQRGHISWRGVTSHGGARRWRRRVRRGGLL